MYCSFPIIFHSLSRCASLSTKLIPLYGIKRNVLFTNRSGSIMNVNFEVTDTKCAILSVHKGCGSGSMIVFTPEGKGKIVNDKKCIEQVKQIMDSTPGFDIVYDRGAYVLDVDVTDGVYVNDERRQFEHEGKQFNKTSMVRINTHLSRSR